MRPEVGSSRRLIIRKVVVFPHPDGPTKARIWPLGIARLSLSTAGEADPGKTLDTSSKKIAGVELTDSRPMTLPEHRLEPYQSYARVMPESCSESYTPINTLDSIFYFGSFWIPIYKVLQALIFVRISHGSRFNTASPHL